MNDRIKEIERQCWQSTDSEPYALFDVKKFAQLMVFECVNAVMDGTKEGDHYAQRIEQHFDNGLGGILHFGVQE